ncbi:hypothetical protein TNCV_188951 [Trichonephila clavipes]|nr:hypothetical protein TNCV_188951 [Trichonephila clavipes]
MKIPLVKSIAQFTSLEKREEKPLVLSMACSGDVKRDCSDFSSSVVVHSAPTCRRDPATTTHLSQVGSVTVPIPCQEKCLDTFHSPSDEAHFWLNGYVNKQNCRIWSEANPQVYVETPLHPEKLTVWCALWAGGILLQKR